MLKLVSTAVFALAVSATAPALAEEPTPYTVHDGVLELPGPVVFETAKATLRPESDDVLAFVQGYLAAKDYITLLRIESHSDNQGKSEWNQKLSEQRALAVALWLVGHGVDCKRLLPVGFGDTKPIADNQTPEGRAQNRRVTFVNAALRGHAIGGMPVDGGGRVAGDPCAH